MSINNQTEFLTKCEILSDLWMNYKDNEELKEFIEFNDLGLPLAHIISEKIMDSTEEAEKYVNETWQNFLEYIGLEDTGFTNLEQLFFNS